ncbi:MAG: DUF3617 domain-containing protein [Alphaproteobacteria bacterium]|nr:DUF3617 domain-containing protein [Alphaproteobacteria bacterium]MBV9541581.1 DUF3617 domain-containing protein [Alphaproteobacteria bacterium]MBV9904915.1 DUF3617 domain-containing protein [Alphaproteobacteria bacterium]
MLKRVAFVAVLALPLVPTAAWAGHGKVGLWETNTTVSMQGMPPQTHAATYCMTAAEVASDTPPASANNPCTYTNVSHAGNTITADMVCKGQMNGTGHFSTTYDTDTHYTANISIAMEGMTMTNTVEGRWLKADCAGAQH